MLFGRRDRSERGVLEFELPVRANGDRAEQFLLQQQPSLYRRRRRAGLLQRSGRQRPMSDVDNATDNIELPERLCGFRQRLLFGRPDDLDRHMLSQRTSAEWSKQESVPNAYLRSR